MNALEQLCARLDCDGETAEKLAAAIEIFGFRAEDTAYAAARIGAWYDLSIPGVKRLLRAYLSEFLSLFEPAASYRIYATVPAPTVLCAALNGSGRLRIHTAEFCAMLVLQGILGLKVSACSPRAGCAHCAMLENRMEWIRCGNFPRPDALWSFGLLCDESPKSDELLGGSLHAARFSTLCPRTGGPERFRVYERSLRRDLASVCSAAESSVPDAAHAWKEARTLNLLAGSITCANSAGIPALKAGTLSLIHSALLLSFGDLAPVLTALREIRAGIRTRRQSGTWKKLYCYYIPPCLPELGEIFAREHIALLGDAAFLTVPLVADYENDLAGYAAASWQSSLLSRSTAENIRSTAEAISRCGCDGYLTGMFSFDRWLGAGAQLSAAGIEAQSAKPVLQCDVDFWGKDFSAAKVENFAQTAAYLLGNETAGTPLL